MIIKEMMTKENILNHGQKHAPIAYFDGSLSDQLFRYAFLSVFVNGLMVFVYLLSFMVFLQQLQCMVTDLQRKMRVLKEKNEQLQNCSTGNGYCSLPHTQPHHNHFTAASAHNTGSLPHVQRNEFTCKTLTLDADSIKSQQTVLNNIRSIDNRQCSLLLETVERQNQFNRTKKSDNRVHIFSNVPTRETIFNEGPEESSHQISGNQRPFSHLININDNVRLRETLSSSSKVCQRFVNAQLASAKATKHSSSVPDLLLVLQQRMSCSAGSGRDEGYWTMGSNVPAASDSRSTLPRASRTNAATSSILVCPSSSSKLAGSATRSPTCNTCCRISNNTKDLSKSSTNSSLKKEQCQLINNRNDLNISSTCTSYSQSSTAFSSSNKWSTVPRFNSSCPNKASMPPSKTHQSISLSKSKYLSPMACGGLVQIISDMMKAVYVIPQIDSIEEYNYSRFPVKLRFMSSSDNSSENACQGVYDLNFQACCNSQCSVCRDMIERGFSTFEVMWPCPEGRKLQLIQMTKRTPSCTSSELVCSNEVSSCSQETTRSCVTQVPNCNEWSSVCHSYTSASCRNSSDMQHCLSSHRSRAGSVTSGSVVPLSSDSEFVQPELEWCGGDFQQPDNDWPQVHELMIPSVSPRSGSCDQLAQYPNDLSCNGSLNSVYVGNLDRLAYRSSSIMYDVRTSSCPDIANMSETFDEPLSESASEGDLMGLIDADDRNMDQGEHRKFYSLLCCEDEDMFSPTAQQFGEVGVMPSLLNMFNPAVSASPSPRDSYVQSSSPLPPEPHLDGDSYAIEEEFPDPPFPEPPTEELMEDLYNIPENCLSYSPENIRKDPSKRILSPPWSENPKTPIPAIPPHFRPVDSPSIPKRVTSRPLPCLPSKVDTHFIIPTYHQEKAKPQLADYTIAEHIESPGSPPPVLPIRRMMSTSSTNSNFHSPQNGNRTLPQPCSPYISSHYTMSSIAAGNRVCDKICKPLTEDHFSVVSSNLPHILPRPPPRAPRRSTSLLGSSRPVSSALEFPTEDETNDNASEGGGGGGYGSLGSSPLEGLESSWVRLNSDALATVSPEVILRQEPRSCQELHSTGVVLEYDVTLL